MRKALFFVILFVFLSFNLNAASFKIAIVDLQKALNLCEAGKAAKAKLAKKFEAMRRELEAKQKELEELKKELEKQSLMLSLEAKRDKEREYERKLRDFRDLYEDYKEEMNIAELEAVKPIINDLKETAEEIRKKEGYVIVLEKNTAGIICYEKEVDITDKVIKLYNKKWKARQKGEK